MLDSETKRRIDNARDILVGKIPDPKAQVEQITIALIYKFMDDMDKSSEEMGGKPHFFTGTYSKYAWNKIIDQKLSGHERLNFYGEAITTMNVNKNIPQLFRDIFKNAFLPYRDPETLNLFLKEINGFTYDHSERLGDAFEYLLSVLGSQGDAGQFRTPRHIIDFIVKIIDPKKNETILDPACGTAGFLISAYKHIVKNSKKPLTPDEKKKLAQNISGYDISPDMVRLSLVNMYLHGFQSPNIHEYDTLTSDDRWNEIYDVIIANPPFMSPKGGIRPHKRFSVQANRSEVLFIDYIAEHLSLHGRAGIIVPEGIIFQSANAHTALRKMLVENSLLYAVISLPAGVFNPYAGVKTSILLMDKDIARKSKEILFIKVENDGFDLGAQRRSIEQNDLTEAFKIIEAWKEGKKVKSKIATYVERAQIAENGDYNLSGDRYRVAIDYSNAKWPMVELRRICTFEYGKPLKEENRINGEYPVFGSNGIVGYHNKYLVEGPFVIIGRKGSAGEVVYSEKNGFPIDTTFYIQLLDRNTIDIRFLYYVLKTLKLDKVNTQAGVPGLNRNDAYKLTIPLPPLEIQQQIVTELKGYQNIIVGAKQVIENWKPKIDIDPEWEKVRLGDVCDIYGGGTPSRSDESFWGGSIPWVSCRYISDEHRIIGSEMITEKGLKNSSSKIAPKGSTVLVTRVSVGKYAVADKDYAINQDLTALVSKHNNLNEGYLLLISEITADKIKGSAVGIGVTGVTRDFIVNQEIPLPPLKMQEQIVERIESERALVESSKKLIEIYENKIKTTISKLWGE